METSKYNPLTWLTIALLLAWPPNWKMRWEINRRKRQLRRQEAAELQRQLA